MQFTKTKQDIIDAFDPSQPGSLDGAIYGLPFDAEHSEFVVIPAPWEVTVSFGSGASEGPEAVRTASFQVDLLNQIYPELWKLGIHYDNEIPDWQAMNTLYKEKALKVIQAIEQGEEIEENQQLKQLLDEVNQGSKIFNEQLKERVSYWQNKGKRVILLGGDHSTPLGYYQALAEREKSFGILHFDAHMDLRIAYEGFTHSHASIMYNALQLPQVSKIVQVGIRDFSEEEVSVIKQHDKQVKVFTDTDLRHQQFEGVTWKKQCEDIINHLPNQVVISFDIDALKRWYCPNTGTPVPGGLSYEQVTYLLDMLANSEKQILGIDLVEVAPGEDEWNGNVGTRLLYHLCGVWAKNAKMPVGEKIEF